MWFRDTFFWHVLLHKEAMKARPVVSYLLYSTCDSWLFMTYNCQASTFWRESALAADEKSKDKACPNLRGQSFHLQDASKLRERESDLYNLILWWIYSIGIYGAVLPCDLQVSIATSVWISLAKINFQLLKGRLSSIVSKLNRIIHSHNNSTILHLSMWLGAVQHQDLECHLGSVFSLRLQAFCNHARPEEAGSNLDDFGRSMTLSHLNTKKISSFAGKLLGLGCPFPAMNNNSNRINHQGWMEPVIFWKVT